MITNPSPPEAISPSELNRQARSLLETHFDWVWVEGELTNFARPSSGHWYFTLKDEHAQVRCAMFRNRNQRLRFVPANGDLVRLRARVSLYEGRGDFQLIGEFMEPAGAGLLQARFEALRDRLRQEGLFNSDRKQPLPVRREHLAVITSPSGAALQDILQVLERRDPSLRISVLPRAVQGDGAAEGLVHAVEQANALHEAGRERFDAIILARGGGSLEDLWAFNDEALARAIAASKLPIVVGVGHEVDVTIADFAADARAPTPSAAAELLSDERAARLTQLERLATQLHRSFAQRLEGHRQRLGALARSLRHPGQRLRDEAQTIDRLDMDLQRAVNALLERHRLRLGRHKAALGGASPVPRVMHARQRITNSDLRLHGALQQRLMRERQMLQQTGARLHSLSPQAILERGYGILQRADGSIIRDSSDAKLGETLHARLARGNLSVEVTAQDAQKSATKQR